MPTSPGRYFAPTYYTPDYFPSLVSADAGAPGTPSPPYRDKDAFCAIVKALTATGEFAAVAFGTTLEGWAAGADRTPAAVITPESWVEVDDVDPVQLVRRVTFLLSILVRDEDPYARFDTLDRLTSVAQNALDGLSLGGAGLPALTLLRQGRFDSTSKHPEQSVTISGEFSSLIPSLTGHDPSS